MRKAVLLSCFAHVTSTLLHAVSDAISIRHFPEIFMSATPVLQIMHCGKIASWGYSNCTIARCVPMATGWCCNNSV